MTPSVGRIIHYVSYGGPGGEYRPACRAAVITQVVTGSDVVGLAVLNPSGLSFHVMVGFDDQHEPDGLPRGGTWHWPEQVD